MVAKKYLILGLIILQIIVIGFLSFKIFQKQKNVLGKTSVSTISKDSINFIFTDNLKYFYEPRENIIIEDDTVWNPDIARYTINSDALNERFEYPLNKTKATFRIIALGDSFTYGLGVNTKDNWTEVLEENLNNYVKKCKKTKKIEVINLGVHGYDIQYEVERYRIRGVKYEPDMILWMLFDPLRIKEYMTPTINTCTSGLSYSKDVLQYKDCWVKSQDILIDKLGKSMIESFLKEKFQSIFKYFNKNVVVLDFLNNHNQILSSVSKIKIFSDFKIAKYLVYGDKKNEYYLYDGHPNQNGHIIIAEDVFNYLIKNKLLPCN